MNRTIFLDFIEGKKKCAKVYEDKTTFAFLDNNPLTKGHALVVPKKPVDHIDHCDEELYISVFKTVRTVSGMLQNSLRPKRIALIVHGTEVPHAHVHVVPLYSGKELRLAAVNRKKASQKEL